MDPIELWSYGEDGRTVPSEDNPRRTPFKSGWTEAVKHLNGQYGNSIYNKGPPPNTLYWHNLGFRVGFELGEGSDSLRDRVYQAYRNEMKANGKHHNK
jgi:hypothetical protein